MRRNHEQRTIIHKIKNKNSFRHFHLNNTYALIDISESSVHSHLQSWFPLAIQSKSCSWFSPPSSALFSKFLQEKKKKKPWDIKETTKNWFNWRIYEKNTKNGSNYFFIYIFYSSNMHSEQQSNLSFIKRSCRLSLSYVVLSKTSTSIVPSYIDVEI